MVRAEKSSMTSRPDGPAQAVSTWSGQAREQAVQRMFTAIAGVYDLNNTLLSFGLHHRWKRLTASHVPAVTNGRALDIGPVSRPMPNN
jgi:demethylmenaquinone methyltransferase/2-methoxy-6-polyprenyl-1,4-benzoquinol methylase